MSHPQDKHPTPLQRLQASRAHMRAFLLEAQTHPESVFQTLLKPLAAEHPIGLSALSALLGAVVVSIKPWRWKALPASWIAWGSLAVTAWLKSRSL